MPKRTRAEIIADLEAKLAEARASDDKAKVTKIEKLEAEVKTFDERIAKLETTKQGKLDEITLIKREIEEAKQTTGDAHVVPAGA